MEALVDVQAIKFIVGWNTILVINAFPDPLLNSCSNSPSSALNILMMVPYIEAVAISVPSELTVSAPTSFS
jgi:hypothetical protein